MGQIPGLPGEEVLVAVRMTRMDAPATHADIEEVFQRRLAQIAGETESLLDGLLQPDPMEGERVRPARLLDAMRYASLGGGKRLRPFFAVESAALFGVPLENALMVGAALE